MNLKKIIAGAAAFAVASTMAVSAFAEYEAYFTFASSTWYPTIMVYDGSNANDSQLTEWKAENPSITADGTYTVKITDLMAEVTDEETGDDILGPMTSEGAAVFCIDIIDLATALGVGKGSDGFEFADSDFAGKMQFAKDKGINITDVSISQTANGNTSSVAVDNSKVYFGDSEGKGNLRIELYNEYGPTVDAPAIDPNELFFSEELSVTFTITGIDAILGAASEPETSEPEASEPEASEPETSEPETEKPNTNTGAEGIAAAAGVAVLAAGAIVVSKKRK